MVLVFAESPRGNLKKTAFEAVTYGKKVADLLGTTCVALTLGKVNDAGELGRYGAARVLNVSGPALDHFDSQTFAAAIADVAKNNGASVVVTSHTSTGKSVAGRLAVRLNAGLVSGVNSLRAGRECPAGEKIGVFGQSHCRIRSEQRGQGAVAYGQCR